MQTPGKLLQVLCGIQTLELHCFGFGVCVQAASTPDALSLPYIAMLPFFFRWSTPGGLDPGLSILAFTFLGQNVSCAKKPVIVVRDLQISFSSGQVLLALATHLLLWSIAFGKKTCLFAVTVSVMFQHIRTRRHSGSWASSCYFIFYRMFSHFSIEIFRCWKQRANPSIKYSD